MSDNHTLASIHSTIHTKFCIQIAIFDVTVSRTTSLGHRSQLDTGMPGGFQCDDTAYSIVISACKRAVMGNLT